MPATLPACRSGDRRRPGILLAVVLAALALAQMGCQPVRETAPAPRGATVGPPPAGEFQVYRIVPAESEVRVLVYRDGPLAKLGHNHVVSSRSLAGEILLGRRLADSRVSVAFPVASFEVDRPEMRTEEGADFPGAIDAAAIAGTRRNMLGDRLLRADTYPEIRLTSREVAGAAPDYVLVVDVTIRGVTGTLRVPARVEVAGNRLIATGRFPLTQGELGLAPLRVMGGLLAVRDELNVRFRIVADRA